MGDTLAALSSPSHQTSVKTFHGPDLNAQGFKPSKSFRAEEHPVFDLETLVAVLKGLEDDPEEMVIRGAFSGSDANYTERSKETFAPKPRLWCMIDIDSLSWDGDLASSGNGRLCVFPTSQGVQISRFLVSFFIQHVG